MLISVLSFSYSQLNIFENKHAYFISNSVSWVFKRQTYMCIILHNNLSYTFTIGTNSTKKDFGSGFHFQRPIMFI